MPEPLSSQQLQSAVVAIAKALDKLGVDYCIMGGAAVHLLCDPLRSTIDVDLVIQHPDISADQLTDILIKFSDEFAPISQFGHTIPGYRLNTPTGDQIMEIEVFDQQSWPERPQYDLKTASHLRVEIDGHKVKFFSIEWLFREKLRAAQGRPSSHRGEVDLNDAARLLPMTRPYVAEMDFRGDEQLIEALNTFLARKPEFEALVRQKVRT